MNMPQIGIVPLIDIQRESYWMLPGYMEGIADAGGLPIMLPLTADPAAIRRIAQLCDGFLFTGGHDVSPELYGQEILPLCGERCPERDAMERLLFPAVMELKKPVLGICRGLQFINVMLGGTLFQDIPAQRPSEVIHHQDPPYDSPSHPVELPSGTPLRELLGRDTISVNSCHHQGIRDLAPALCSMANAPDGLVEAVWAADRRYVWAVQWHPEFSRLKDDHSRHIFQSFVDAAR